ncbi:MAG: hypothetical protein WBL61_00970 [Bryobacteraceae bacterium]
MAAMLLPAWAAAQAPAKIEVNAGRVLHVMTGGTGASWHAMGQTAYWYKDITRVNRNSRGSGWGGNPPNNVFDTWCLTPVNPSREYHYQV